MISTSRYYRYFDCRYYRHVDIFDMNFRYIENIGNIENIDFNIENIDFNIDIDLVSIEYIENIGLWYRLYRIYRYRKYRLIRYHLSIVSNIDIDVNKVDICQSIFEISEISTFNIGCRYFPRPILKSNHLKLLYCLRQSLHFLYNTSFTFVNMF